MSRLQWFGSICSAFVAAYACGGDDANPDRADAGDAGPDAPHIVDAGSGGMTADAPPSTPDAEPEDSGPGKDTLAPTFSGVKGVDILDDRRVRVFWDKASDDVTPDEQIAYRVYRATEEGAQDFSRALRCGTKNAPDTASALAPCYSVALSGTTSFTFTEITPGVDFHFLVHAVDSVGNEDDNEEEVVAQTSDATSPEFGGVKKVLVASATSIEVRWGEAYDKPVPASLLEYEVFVKQEDRPDPEDDDPVYVSDPGELFTVVTDLEPLTTYWVHVRVKDPSGNVDDNGRFVAIRTPEGIPPAFDGIKRSDVSGTTVRLFWTPATDNTTEPQNIVYDVWQSLRSRGQDYNKAPTYTSKPGAASITIDESLVPGGLEPGTEYYYVVKARDVAGNRDDNIKERAVRTELVNDTIAPTFNGVTSITPTSTSTLELAWGVAADDDISGVIEFDVYASDSSGVTLNTPIAKTTARRLTITGLAPNTQRCVVVKARDEAGNVDSNTKELCARTAAVSACPGDSSPPVWNGGLSADLVPQFADRLDVAWTASSDTGSTADGGSAGCTGGQANVRYHVCVAEAESDCTGTAFNNHVRTTTNYGAVSVRLTGLAPRTDYFVSVRPEDRAGNLETGNHTSTARTATSFSDNVRPLLFNKCIACHSGEDRGTTNGRDVLAYDQLADIRNVTGSYVEDEACKPGPIPPDGCVVKLVDPGRPQFSLIYRKVNPLGLQTPPFSAAVPNFYNGLREPRDSTENFSADEDLILREWIEQGAFGN